MPETGELTRLRWAPLRLCLLAQVLLDVVFVQITGAVSTAWLVPLFALTLLSPWLVRWQPRALYRLVWNLGVLGIFALLIEDAGRRGVRYLLEYGLILAAFCQVHLLNNLGPKQKPDLLFFNSFLIALVTSFFCQDLQYATVFAVYAIVLIVGLQLASTPGSPPPGFLRGGLARAGVALALTLLVFLVWPRDFQREGLIGDALRHARSVEVGFSEQVELGESAHIAVSNRVVLRIHRVRGSVAAVPVHWRGATLWYFDGRRWYADSRPRSHGSTAPAHRWLQRGRGWIRVGFEDAARVVVEVLDERVRYAFAPLQTHAIELEQRNAAVTPRGDGTLRLWMREGPAHRDEPLRYRLRLHRAQHRWASEPRHREDVSSAYLVLPGAGLSPSVRELAGRLAAPLAGAPQHIVVEAMRSHLASSYSYLLPGTPGAARDLDDFLTGARAGHCEYFATALALMLRTQRIPARLVTGYASAEWDAAGEVLTVRASDAHAWVEVLDPAGFWYPVDPTPPASGALETAPGPWERLREVLQRGWAALTGFDGASRDVVLDWVRRAPGAAAAWLHAHPFAAAGLLVLLAGWLGCRRARRARGLPPAVRDYLRALAHAGVQPRPGETPRELVARARAAGVAPPRLAQLEQTTRAHEHQRYG